MATAVATLTAPPVPGAGGRFEVGVCLWCRLPHGHEHLFGVIDAADDLVGFVHKLGCSHRYEVATVEQSQHVELVELA